MRGNRPLATLTGIDSTGVDSTGVNLTPVKLALAASQPEIVFEDNHVVVAFKPAGYLSQADQSGKPDMLSWLKADIKVRYNKPGDVFIGLVHRLDQPVSGLMVFARTSKAASRLSQQVRLHQFGKYYLAVVRGRPEPENGHLEDNLIKNREANQVHVCGCGEGQLAFLDYQVLAYDAEHDCSMVRIQLGTGRSHQIRVQFSSRGWPLVGDRRYGGADRSGRAVNPGRPGQTVNSGSTVRAGLSAANNADNQLALLAYRLDFKHPTREERLDFSIEPPAVEPWLFFNLR